MAKYGFPFFRPGKNKGNIRRKYGAGRVAALLLCLLVLAPAGRAGSFRSLGMKEGLSSRQVFQINKDSAGFIWAYTHMGIDRYDGNEIKHYRLDDTVESKDHILSSTVMTCDRSGSLWVALKNGKIYAYDRQADTFSLRINLSEHLSGPVFIQYIV